MAFDWISGLFQNEQTRGLSGDNASAVALDDSNPYYNYRLRRHKADEDLVADPTLLWYTSPYVKQRQGLGTHIAAEQGEGVANFTDVLLIISQADYERAASGSGWLDDVRRTLTQEFETFCRREKFSRLYAHRQLGFKILVDGSDDMGGQVLGLDAGEFITGLLPNLYTGPVAGSFPVIGVHVNLPGVWDGYQEVGRLYNDQMLFTLGSHWLDNFSHPSLKEAALYRLQQYPDGSFVHIVNPDLQDRYQVTSTEQNGASVLTLATRDGQPLAYVVLAVIDPPAAKPAGPDISMPAPPDNGPPSMAPPMLIDDEVQQVQSPEPAPLGSMRMGSKTIIPDAPSERIFTLQERGALLQKVHFSAFMLGYDVFLGKRGELGTVVDNKAATFQVRKRSVSLLAHVDLVIGGEAVRAGTDVPIEGDVTIEVAGERLLYRDLRGQGVDGWPYVGEIRRPASSSYLIWGDAYRVGRSRECRVVLPDEPRNDNIHWKPSVGDGATIRARTGEIPKSRFYTDSIMVASEHGVLDLSGDQPKAVCTARHCYVYIRRADEILPLFPSTSSKEPKETDLEPGDEILIGNCLFQVGYSPAGEAVAPAPAPKVELTPDSMVDSVDAPNFDDLDEDEDPAEDRRKRRERVRQEEKVVSAGGLGETGSAPEPVALEPVGMDSIMGQPLQSPPPAPMRLSDLTEEPPPLPEGDEPTMPGVPVPRELIESSEDVLNQSLDVFEESLDAVPPEPPVTPSTDTVANWEDEDWETGSAQGGAHSEAPPPKSVPAPFPEVETEGPLSSTWDDPPELPQDPALETMEVDGPPPPPTDVPPPLPPSDVPPPLPPQDSPPPLPADDVPPPVPVPPPAPAEEAPAAAPVVVVTDDNEAQFELGRPLHIIQAGWMVKGEMVCGNHTGSDLVIPENRIVEGQSFAPQEYFRLKVRGRRGSLELLTRTEVLINEDDPSQDTYDNLGELVIDVIRRDDNGEEDFAVRLQVKEDKALPDPRARFVEIDWEDPLAAALVTRGLPKGQARRLSLGGVGVDCTYDDGQVTLSNYLEDYRLADGGYRAFFVQRGDARFVTAPEDGEAIVLSSGDRIVVEGCVYILVEE